MWLSNVVERENAPTEYPYEKKNFRVFANHDNCHGVPDVILTNHHFGFVSFRFAREEAIFEASDVFVAAPRETALGTNERARFAS